MLESNAADLPSDLRRLFESGAVTIDQSAILHNLLDITSAADLISAVRRQTIRRAPGLGEAIELAIERALPTLRAGTRRIPLGRAVAIAEPFLQRLRRLPAVAWAEPVGSLRRGQDTVGDIEIVAPAVDPQRVFDVLAGMPGISQSLARGAEHLYVVVDGVQVGIRCPRPHVAGAVLLHLTGSPGHVAALATLAAGRGWNLAPDGLDRHDGSRSIGSTEEAIYTALGLAFIPPELREGAEAIAAAADGSLPDLVEVQHIRGDLHMHTDWSDGRNPIEVMVHAAVALGYQYLAITDHSEHSAASRSLSRADVFKQQDAIAAVREECPQIEILHGCEVDIMASGKLDFPDSLLQEFDIVLASLHDRAGHAPDKLERRYAQAMRHPLVTIITHPTNRLVGHRPGYPLNWDRVIAGAVETGTVLEVDGAPSHLDMDGALTRRAITAGACVSIDSDCHVADLLGRQMQLGVRTARRGWVEARHVINTRSIADVRALIAAKRSR